MFIRLRNLKYRSMGSLLMFALFIFILIIVVPIVGIIRVLSGVRKSAPQQQNRRAAYQQPEKPSPVNKRFDKSKAEDVEFEEV